ncbi:MAG: Kelch repeat-containing protein, partial [Dehalococcoidia bacterium]
MHRRVVLILLVVLFGGVGIGRASVPPASSQSTEGLAAADRFDAAAPTASPTASGSARGTTSAATRTRPAVDTSTPWTQGCSPTCGPAARWSASVAGGVLFGGESYCSNPDPNSTCRTYFSETWVWDGSQWTDPSQAHFPPQPLNPHPAARAGASMAFNPKTSQVVLYGGADGSYVFGDTWVWDGQRWTAMCGTGSTSACPPGTREHASMAFDGQNIVLFGGASSDAFARIPYNDTWIWNGSTWSAVCGAAGMPACPLSTREKAGMADAAAGKPAVLFGGNHCNDSNSSCSLLNETWTWNGSTWTNVTPASGNPPERQNAGMASNPATGVVVLFGGSNYSSNSTPVTYLGDTWLWDGNAWTQAAPATNPGARSELSLASFGTTSVMLFGGYDGYHIFADTWFYGSAPAPTATPSPSASPTASPSPTGSPTPTPSPTQAPPPFLRAWGSQGTGPGQFNYPVAVAVDGSGNVYVADQGNDRIQKFDSQGNPLTAWGSQGSGPGQFNHPLHIGLDPAGNVYVADVSNNRIQKFDSLG